MDSILIKNGLLFEPTSMTLKVGDIAISEGEIIQEAVSRPDIEIDAEECIVTPGLIDFHLHCYTQGTDGSNDPDTFCLPNGVTTCIDAGSSGSANFPGFYNEVIVRSVTRVLALLHVAPEGLTTGLHAENQTVKDWDRSRIKRLFARYPQLVGLKVRQGHNVCDPYGLHDEPLIEAVKLGQELGKKVVVHVNDPNVDCGTIASELRAGDVYCHMYAGFEENILNADGSVKDAVKRARERGVLFDCCNGRGNFLFSVAEAAIQDGFMPDIISSDNNPLTNYRHPLISLPRLLARYLMFGMSLQEVLAACTITPARWLGMEELATLRPGTPADLAIFKLKEGKYLHKDRTGAERWGNQMLVPQMTIREGEIVYSQTDFQ